MLSQLIISDFAIISHLEIEFKSGLNILSGETGAGKSIIINAVNLILGGRASTDLIRSGASEARVEALFHQPENVKLAEFMAESGILFNGELIIKRIISREGRNKITVNDSMVTLQTLSALGMMIISISGQHEHQVLLKPENHLFLLDDLGDLNKERNELSDSYEQYESLEQKIKKLGTKIKENLEKQELNLFQIREIEDAAIQDGEDEDLKEEKSRLKNAEQIRDIMTGSYYRLYEMEDSIISGLSLCLKDIKSGTHLDSRLNDIFNALDSAKAELEDASYQLGSLKDDISMDPVRLEQVEERLHTINKLKKKYGPSIKDIVLYREDLSRRVHNIDEQKDELKNLKMQLQGVTDELLKKASMLSGKRRQIASEMNESVEYQLNQLEMKGTRFEVKFYNEPMKNESREVVLKTIKPEGYDRIEFLIAPNVGEELRPLSKIVSGGELSRIMLAIKTILAQKTSVETIIFDEVDAGIGGATAEVVGEKINALSDYHQILCITHLPQIACKGHNHFLVKKEIDKGRTRTMIFSLDSKERINEIARLMGGRVISEQAIAHAKEMLELA